MVARENVSARERTCTQSRTLALRPGERDVVSVRIVRLFSGARVARGRIDHAHTPTNVDEPAHIYPAVYVYIYIYIS